MSTSGSISAVNRSFPFKPADMPVQELVGDEAGEDRQQQRVDHSVADTAPEQLEDEVGAVRPRRRVGVLKTLKTRKAARTTPTPRLQRQRCRKISADIDLLDANVGSDECDRDGEVDEVEDVVLQVEHRDAQVRDQERDAADEANQATCRTASGIARGTGCV